MGRIYAGFDAFFAAEGWLRLENEAEAFFKLFYEGRHGQWECFAQADEAKEWGFFLAMMERYWPALTAVVEDGREPLAALAG